MLRKLALVLVGVVLAGGAASLILESGMQAKGSIPREQRVPAVEVSERGTASFSVPSKPAAAKPACVLAHYGFGEGGYRPFAVLDFGSPAVGAALPGTVGMAGEGTVEVKSPDGTVLTYEGLEQVSARPGEVVRAGDPLGFAGGPVSLRAERGGRLLDPVALLWPEMSRFALEAEGVEKERKKLAEEFRRRALQAVLGKLRPPEHMGELIKDAAEEVGLDPALVAAVAAVESGFNPRAVSSKGAMGVMQLLPGTARAVGVSDPFDPAQNVRGGARYLRGLLDRFGELELALAAYNAGPGAVERYGGVPPYPETMEYVKAVIETYQKGSGRK